MYAIYMHCSVIMISSKEYHYKILNRKVYKKDINLLVSTNKIISFLFTF